MVIPYCQQLSVVIGFVDHPEVPMDNNKGEQSTRTPVTGRKNFYGTGSLWSSHLAAIMFSIFQTMVLCGLNNQHWLRSYLTACAELKDMSCRVAMLRMHEDGDTLVSIRLLQEHGPALSRPYADTLKDE
jgi:hypothetical protein